MLGTLAAPPPRPARTGGGFAPPPVRGDRRHQLRVGAPRRPRALPAPRGGQPPGPHPRAADRRPEPARRRRRLARAPRRAARGRARGGDPAPRRRLCRAARLLGRDRARPTSRTRSRPATRSIPGAWWRAHGASACRCASRTAGSPARCRWPRSTAGCSPARQQELAALLHAEARAVEARIARLFGPIGPAA